MKEAIVTKDITVRIRDVPIPKPKPGQLLIRTIVSGTNPKDWKYPKVWGRDLEPRNQGDDIAGYVEAVGENVTGFSPGDRVAAFHELGTPYGSYAEYSIAWANSAFHIPADVTFEEAATIPLAGMTAALGVYQRLNLPVPWNPATKSTPFIVYGGATAVGAFAIKLAKLSNIHPIVAIAGNGIPFVQGLLEPEKGDVVIDYRKGNDFVADQIHQATGGRALHAFDGVSEKGSINNIGKALAPGGAIAIVLTEEMRGYPEDACGADVLFTMVGTVHLGSPASAASEAAGAAYGDREFGIAFFHYFGVGLAEGWFSGHPYEVQPGGLSGIENALKILEAGKLSAKKLVITLADN